MLNKIGQRPTINRCLLLPYPLNKSEFTDQFLVLGCHFTRNEMPFIYDTKLNKYSYKFELDPTEDRQQIQADPESASAGLNLDLYRSNDYVQIHEDHVYLRPFVKVGETADDVKVIRFPVVGKA